MDITNNAQRGEPLLVKPRKCKLKLIDDEVGEVMPREV